MSTPVIYTKDFVTNPDDLFTQLWAELEWEKRDDAPRKEYWTNTRGVSYSYGRGAGLRTYYPKPTHTAIERVKALLTKELGFEYEACFLNGYANERDGLGWHADDDPKIDHSKPIAVVTVGAGRMIEFKPIEGGETTKVFLEPGSLLLMRAGMQSTHLHRIPKAGMRVDPRISLTFRALA